MPAECASPIVGILTKLAGIAAGGMIGLFSARKISDCNALATATAKYRAAFTPALASVTVATFKRITDVGEFNLSVYLKESFVHHAVAVGEFRPFIPKERRVSCQRAWEQYLELDSTVWNGLAEFMAEHVNPDDPLKFIRARLKALFSYSES